MSLHNRLRRVEEAVPPDGRCPDCNHDRAVAFLFTDPDDPPVLCARCAPRVKLYHLSLEGAA